MPNRVAVPFERRAEPVDQSQAAQQGRALQRPCTGKGKGKGKGMGMGKGTRRARVRARARARAGVRSRVGVRVRVNVQAVMVSPPCKTQEVHYKQ